MGQLPLCKLQALQKRFLPGVGEDLSDGGGAIFSCLAPSLPCKLYMTAWFAFAECKQVGGIDLTSVAKSGRNGGALGQGG